MSVKLALLCKKGEGLKLVKKQAWTIKPDTLSLSPDDHQLWETGSWIISTTKAKDLIGSDVVIAQSTNDPAYIGGEIVSLSDNQGRISLTFRENPKYRGYTNHIDGWKSSNPVHYL